MTLSLYFARRFLMSVGVVALVFAGILLLIDVVEQIRRHAGSPQMTLGTALHLAALNLSGGIYRILPLVVMLGSVALFLGLARTSELVVTRAAGRSALRALVAPVVAAMLLGGVALAVLNPLVAATSRAATDLGNAISQGSSESLLMVSREGLWLRQAGADGQVVIRAARSNADGTQLFAVTFLAFAADGQPTTRMEAAEARLMPGRWLLSDVKEWPLQARNPEVSATRAARAEVPTDLTAERIRDSFNAPDAVAIWDLPAFIDGLDRAGLSSQRHRVWLQRELALPVTLAAMVLLAAGFTMRHVRFGKSGTMVLFAVLAGFAMFFLRNFAQVLGETGQIPAPLAAWAPPVIAGLFALGLLLHLEDG